MLNKQGNSTFMRVVISFLIAIVMGGSIFGGFMALSKGLLSEKIGSQMEEEAAPVYEEIMPPFTDGSNGGGF